MKTKQETMAINEVGRWSKFKCIVQIRNFPATSCHAAQNWT